MTVMDVVAVPERSHQQRIDALERGNRIRMQRAELKRDIKAGRENPLDYIEHPPEWLETMKVYELLLAVPKIGRVKADTAFRRLRISHSKTLGGLSERQRGELVKWFVWR